MTDDPARHDTVQEWVSLPEAARLAQVSERTMRRRVQTGLVESRIDPDDGRGRYLIRSSSVVSPSPSSQLIPIAILERLEALRIELTAAEVARARAETVAEFQSQRAAQEIERRLAVEAEVERLTAEIQGLTTVPRRWWQKRPVV